jgi:hypothetical protein
MTHCKASVDLRSFASEGAHLQLVLLENLVWVCFGCSAVEQLVDSLERHPNRSLDVSTGQGQGSPDGG